MATGKAAVPPGPVIAGAKSGLGDLEVLGGHETDACEGAAGKLHVVADARPFDVVPDGEALIPQLRIAGIERELRVDGHAEAPGLMAGSGFPLIKRATRLQQSSCGVRISSWKRKYRFCIST